MYRYVILATLLRTVCRGLFYLLFVCTKKAYCCLLHKHLYILKHVLSLEINLCQACVKLQTAILLIAHLSQSVMAKVGLNLSKRWHMKDEIVAVLEPKVRTQWST